MGPKFTEPGVYEPISGMRLSGSIRHSLPAPGRGARPPVEIWMIASGSRSLTRRTVSRKTSTRIVGFLFSSREWMCSTDTPSLMHSCMSSAISCGEQGRAGFFSRVLMLPVVASVITSLPCSFVSADGLPSLLTTPNVGVITPSMSSPQRMATVDGRTDGNSSEEDGAVKAEAPVRRASIGGEAIKAVGRSACVEHRSEL